MRRGHTTLWQGSLLGALNGALYSSALFFFEHQYIQFLIEREIEDEKLGIPPVQITSGTLNRPVITACFAVSFALASYVAHRYLVRLQKYSILFWQVVGITGVVGWNLVFIALLWIEKESTGEIHGYETATSNLLFGSISLGLVIVTNLIFGLVVRALGTIDETKGRFQL